MSTAVAEKKSADTAKVQYCASCGIAGGDGIKLKDCSACHLVKYCSVKCQKDHRPKHKKECKKRAAELRDELLFKQPESSHFGDCPICCLPLHLDDKKSFMMSCCSKQMCNGCTLANNNREIEGRLQQKCPFCRMALPATEEEHIEQVMKRIETNDPVAMRSMGTKRCEEGDYKSAFGYFTEAVALGDDALAHYQLSILYRDGKGIKKDEKRSLHHAEEAAIGGHPDARYNLGCVEWENGRMGRAAKHWIIAAKLGHDGSLGAGALKRLYQVGCVSKEDFASALRGCQAAIDATKSPQREEAARARAKLLNL